MSSGRNVHDLQKRQGRFCPWLLKNLPGRLSCALFLFDDPCLVARLNKYLSNFLRLLHCRAAHFYLIVFRSDIINCEAITYGNQPCFSRTVPNGFGFYREAALSRDDGDGLVNVLEQTACNIHINTVPISQIDNNIVTGVLKYRINLVRSRFKLSYSVYLASIWNLYSVDIDNL